MSVAGVAGCPVVLRNCDWAYAVSMVLALVFWSTAADADDGAGDAAGRVPPAADDSDLTRISPAIT